MFSPDDGTFRDWRFESLEDRLALTAQPVADFWYDLSLDGLRDTAIEVVGPGMAADSSAGSQLAAARTQLGQTGTGPTGRGQTVAVIDSGVAYDHEALGGGFGRGYKVVGGWDFAENDANPYDDGPAGFHGTHVAGIVGAADARNAGIAPGVDLVSLRVFNDQGSGYFSWVEEALTWVHQNRNRFESPITTVNLSLGTEWNATTLPKWATLENELQQLADDGIFVSVAAGNSFITYGAAGLSYPAVSPSVTPVASVDANGNLSRFSQRSANVLAAPGERVLSTVPDAFYGGDGVKNDWGAASGTSMAAPYVAGAAVLVREALQQAGHSDIRGSTISDLLHRTADVSFDAITGVSYHRVNLSRALSSLDQIADERVSIRGETASVQGTIGDDTIVWQADRRQLTINGQEFDLRGVTQIVIAGAGGNDQLSLFGSAAKETLSASPGNVELAASGYRLTATSVETVRFVGDQQDQGWLSDSAGVDLWEASPAMSRMSGAGYRIELVGVGSMVATSQNGGRDVARISDSAGNDTLTAGPQAALLQGGGVRIEARGFAEVIVHAGAGGYDTATLQDSPGRDELEASSRYAWLRGSNYSLRAEGFDSVIVRSTLGTGDVARLYGNDGVDVLSVWSNQRNFYSAGVVIQTFNFRFAAFDGGGGLDRVDYYTSRPASYLYGRANYGSIVDQAFETQFFGVESVLASLRNVHRVKTDLAALEFHFRKMGRK